MKFRPCIDIHNGKVKQIVGGSLTDNKNFAKENFVATKNADFYANLYKEHNLSGGHIIILNDKSSEYFEASQNQALLAINNYKNNLQIGGGVNNENASFYLEKGASHVIVTSFVFKNGEINMGNLDKLVSETGKEKLVLDLSCRKKDDEYFIVTDRWQNFTNVALNSKTIAELSSYCDEFLIHAVDVEGKGLGIDSKLLEIMAENMVKPITYAGGIHNFSDIEIIREKGKSRIDFTVGSALDLFGGEMKFNELLNLC